MKKLILTAAIFTLSLLSYAQAQGPGERKFENDPKTQTEKMTADLGLTDAQKTQVLIINNDAANKKKAMRANQTEGVDKHEGMKKIESDRETALKGILTEEQFKKYIKIREDARKQRN